MMSYLETAMPSILGCPDKLSGFYDKLDLGDEERMHAIGVSAECTRKSCTRFGCPFRAIPDLTIDRN